MEEKTNVMRLLEKAKIKYKSYQYLNTGAIGGIEVAKVLKQDPNQVFKTLVTMGKSNKYYVFMLPVKEELDMKKAAKSVQEKAIEMLPVKELLFVTGYIHGGCSPIGMKKTFRTIIAESARKLDTIIFSGGKIGYQVELSLEDLKKVVPFTFANIVK